jgi:Plasmid pRiA4b ORF-3-like protein
MLDMEPAVSRLLSLPPTTTFAKFHEILQVSFGWAHCHMHAFQVQWITEDGWSPALMSLSASPLEFEYMNDHKEADWTLADVYEKPEWKGKVRVTYEYDMGDGWEHDVCLLGRQEPASWKQMTIPSDMKAVCLTGHGHPVAEDSGGPPGWEALKELFEKPRAKDEDGQKNWYKTQCANGDKKGLNPHEWDRMKVNTDLSDIGL